MSIALLLAFLPAGAVRFLPLPRVMTIDVCVQRAMVDGVRIAQIRWHPRGITIEEWRDAPYAPGLPDWYMQLIDGWIAAAIAWPGTDEQFLDYLLASCYRPHTET